MKNEKLNLKNKNIGLIILLILFSTRMALAINKSDTIIISQKINFDSEQIKILNFLNEFGSFKDSVAIQKHIYFPFFFSERPNSCGGSEYPCENEDKTVYNFDKFPLCKSPMAEMSYKYRNEKTFRDSIKRNNNSFFDYFYNKKENRNNYCAWFIHCFKFPLTFEESDILKIKPTFSKKIINGRIIETIVLRLKGYFFYYHLKQYFIFVIELYKIDDQYKIYGFSTVNN